MTHLPQFFLSYPLVPAEEAVEGIKFDFCDGCRILFPRGTGEHRVVLSDNDSDTVLQNTLCCDGAKFRSDIRYYVNWNVKIYNDEGVIFQHDYNCYGKEVLFIINSGAIGDTIAWFPYIDKFQRKYNCKAGVIMSKTMRPLFEGNYENITFFGEDMEKSLAPYATYYLGINYECNQNMQKRTFYSVPLHHLIGYDLGFDNDIEVERPRLTTLKERLIKEPYVCISVKGSRKCKCWNNPEAIYEVVSYLSNAGYRVLLIDKELDCLYGAENFTGDKPLIERATLLRDCELFIGCPSGLSWIAWAVNCKVVMVSGFSEPWAEFYTPYRAQNANVCHGCWNILSKCHHAEDDCPEGKDYECTRSITSKLVIAQIKRALESESNAFQDCFQ